MTQTIRARYHDGQLEPLEPLELEEGCEVLITVESSPVNSSAATDPTLATAGVFKGSREWEEFEESVQERRLREDPIETNA